MNEQVIAFVVAMLCSGALVTVYILWLAGLFSNRSKPQSVYDAIIMDAIVLKKVEEWLAEEVIDERVDIEEYQRQEKQLDSIDAIIYGRHECAESLQNMIKQWRTEVDITITK